MVGAVRCVHRSLISSGRGWMDAEPEIDAIAPHVYIVNEDGDQQEKRDFCRAHGLDTWCSSAGRTRTCPGGPAPSCAATELLPLITTPPVGAEDRGTDPCTR